MQQRLKWKEQSSITQLHSKHITKVVFVMMVFAGIFRYPGLPIHLESAILFEFAVCMVFAGVLWGTNKWVTAFLLLAMVSMVYPFYDKASHLAFQAILYGMVWFYVIVSFVDNKHVHYILNAMCIIVLINVLLIVLQTFNVDPIFAAIDGGKDQTTGFMGNRNLASALLAIGLPAFFRDKWKWLLPVILVGLLLARSTSGIVALAAGMLFFAYKHQKLKLAVGVMAIGIILFIMFVDQPVISRRLNAWIHGLKLAKQHWIMGSGLGHWKVVLDKIRPLDGCWWATAHNEFVQGVFEMGIGFAVIVIGYFVDIIRKYRDTALIPATALIIIITNASINFPFHSGTVAMMALTWMAILQIKLNLCSENEQ